MKANLLVIFVFLFSAVPATFAATPYGSPYQGRHQDMAPPSQPARPASVLKSGINKLTAFIKSGKARDRSLAMRFLESEIAPYFDFEYMTRWSAGPAWRRMNAQQRASMQEQLAKSFLTTLAQKLTTYTNQPIRYFTARGQYGNDVTVNAWVMQATGQPTKLEFRFYKSKQGWKIFDVKAAGNSAVVYYRNQFKQMLRNPDQSGYYY